TIFVTAMYLFRSITCLFAYGPKTYWPSTGQQAQKNQVIQPQFLNVSILSGVLLTMGLLGVLLTSGWMWFATFLSPAISPHSINSNTATVEVSSIIWVLVPLVVAVAGWAVAYSMHTRPPRQLPGTGRWATSLYVLFWNKFYFDELYDAYVVNPTLRFANWLWRRIDVRIIDSAIHGIASSSLLFARWLWRVVDIKGIDRIVLGVGQHSVGLGQWIWKIIDVGWIEKKTTQDGIHVDYAGQTLQDAEPRTIQHQLLVMILWLVLAIGLLYIVI
ncbi:MAG: hypothetical protein ACPGYT_08985, partial [Nitrospirales bacterium]